MNGILVPKLELGNQVSSNEFLVPKLRLGNPSESDLNHRPQEST